MLAGTVCAKKRFAPYGIIAIMPIYKCGLIHMVHGMNGKSKRIRMSYRNLEAEQLVPLRDALEELMLFLYNWQDCGVPHFYRYLDFMKNNIETCICTREDQGEGLIYLRMLLQRDWDKANDEYVGIPSCVLFQEGQRELFLQYLGLLDEVGSYFILDTD